ncbi:MAG TPA: hypothetical protein VLF39_02160 [Candidatus Saccharimonadales bacterium]|nr:hypothetical protein [Candidatus Saccharimonadales bacterium]
MALANESKTESRLTDGFMVAHTPVLHRGDKVNSTILITAGLIERVTLRTLTGIEDYPSYESANSALANWVGRFATDELLDNEFRASGWDAKRYDSIADLDKLDPRRQLPFLIRGQEELGRLVICSEINDPEMFEVETEFTPRAIDFLEEIGVLG